MNDDMLPENIQGCLVYAARYAHNRQTGAALQVVNAIKSCWHQLSARTQIDLIEESYEATTNLDDWRAFWSFTTHQIPKKHDIARDIACYLWEDSRLRHGQFTPTEFKDIVASHIDYYLKTYPKAIPATNPHHL
jgi:hypothetical protein